MRTQCVVLGIAVVQWKQPMWHCCMALHAYQVTDSLSLDNLICMHAQPRVQHWTGLFLFEMIAITVSGDHTRSWHLLGNLIAING